jgi:MFS family permease
MAASETDNLYAWLRLAVSLALAIIGGIGAWASVVALPAIQVEFGIDRAGASLPYTVTMIGFAIGGMIMGRFADRRGIAAPLLIGAFSLGAGFILAGLVGSYIQFLIVQFLLIGLFGSSATLGPLIADVSQWFLRRRGIAVAIVASGNYLAGTIWPPFLQQAISAYGWRATFIAMGVLCIGTMVPLALLVSRRPVYQDRASPANKHSGAQGLLERPAFLQPLLVLAGLACCVAMSMPQVHIVAYCGDLGYGPARGAEMLSLMLGCGVISRLACGAIADRIGGTKTLIAGSLLQCLALLFYIPFDGLASLYIVSAFFGLAQGGIVPSYALIIRDYFPAREAGFRISLVLTATVLGMALGGWMSGEIFDLTGSYQAAFFNGILWNLLNLAIAVWLVSRRTPRVTRIETAPVIASD